MNTLPFWLQWLVSLATVLSSIGVIVALIQLRISSNQFNRQLRLTQQQFKLTNQGYIQPELDNGFLTSNNTYATEQETNNLNTLYVALSPVLTLTNVGNLPVKYLINYFRAYFNEVEIYHTPEAVLTEKDSILYPKQRLSFMLGQFSFNSQMSYVTLQQMQDLKITYQFEVSYNDYNDNSVERKTINREVALSGILLINKNFYDTLPHLEFT